MFFASASLLRSTNVIIRLVAPGSSPDSMPKDHPFDLRCAAMAEAMQNVMKLSCSPSVVPFRKCCLSSNELLESALISVVLLSLPKLLIKKSCGKTASCALAVLRAIEHNNPYTGCFIGGVLALMHIAWAFVGGSAERILWISELRPKSCSLSRASRRKRRTSDWCGIFNKCTAQANVRFEAFISVSPAPAFEPKAAIKSLQK